MADTTLPRPVSIPAFDLNERHEKEARFTRIANYQIANLILLLLAASSIGGWIFTAVALRDNSEALRRFKPVVVRENELGQTTLLASQNLNFQPDSKSVRSALQFWATYHYSRMRATIQDFRGQSFSWMDQKSADSIRRQDQESGWIRKFLKSSDPEYKVVVSNVVLTEILKSQDGSPESGKADIYAHRKYFATDGYPDDSRPDEPFIIHVNWAVAVADSSVVGVNPLGIAVLDSTIFEGLKQ